MILLLLLNSIFFNHEQDSKMTCIDHWKVRVIETPKNKKSRVLYLFLDFYECVPNKDSAYIRSEYLQNKASQEIYLLSNSFDTIRPVSYLCEGDFGGVRPYARSIISFEGSKISKGKSYDLYFKHTIIHQLKNTKLKK